jgi:hypothetical protein
MLYVLKSFGKIGLEKFAEDKVDEEPTPSTS